MDNQKQQFFAARISIFVSIILFFISAIIGIWIDSITLILDASASLVILTAAFLMHFSIKKIHQPPDDLYHFGYHKYEPLTSAIQNGLIIVTCVVSVKFALQDIVHAEDVHSYSIPAAATFFSGVLSAFVSGYFRRISLRTNSQIIKAASLHWVTDTVLSFSVCAGFLLGLMMQMLHFTKITPYIDPVMAILLALFFIAMPFKGGMNSLLELLDAAPVEDIRRIVRKVVGSYADRVLGVHHLRIRKAGQKVFVDVRFGVRGDLMVSQAGDLAEGFERDLRIHLPDCDVVVSFKSQM